MTAGSLIARSLKLLGVIAAGETADADDSLDALDTLNDLVDAWALDTLWIYTVARVTKTLTVGTATYTIGTGGSISTARPAWIESALLILDSTVTPPTEIPLEVLTDQRWQGTAHKTLSGQPMAVFYDRADTAGLGTVNVYPVTSQANQSLVLYLPSQPVASFADLTTDYTFPPGYKRALRYNLAIELAPEYGKSVPQELAMIAATSLADVRRANIRPVELGCDVALLGHSGRFDPYSGELG